MLHMFSESILLVRIILFLTVTRPRVIITLVLKSFKITIFCCDIFLKNIFINLEVVKIIYNNKGDTLMLEC